MGSTYGTPTRPATSSSGKRTMMSRLTLATIVAARSQQVSADLEGEAVILDLERGRYYGLNEVGARVWSLVQEPRSVSEIRDCLLGEYAVDASQCEADLFALLG